MLNKLIGTAFVAAVHPGALLFPYVNGVVDGAAGVAGFMLIRNGHPVFGGILFAYGVLSSTLTVANLNRKG